MLFEEKDYGKPISQGLSDYLKEYITKKEIADIAIKYDLSYSTVRDVMYRKNSITERNEPAMTELVKVAIQIRTYRNKNLLATHKKIAVKAPKLIEKALA